MVDNLSVGDSWGSGAARDLGRWGLFLIRSQDWSLLHIQGWFLGRSQDEVPVAANWHPVVPGRPELGRVAAVCEMVA